VIIEAPYCQHVIPYVERALALMDGNPASKTYGCADRTFWQYRTLTNFPAASMQQLMLGLAVVYTFEAPDNPYHGATRILDAARAMLGYWCKIQNRDGSFNEWYQNENSYCPTAFTTAGAALTVLKLGDQLPTQERAKAVRCLEHAASWLDDRFNPTVMNQNLVAALGLWVLWRLTDKPVWRRAAEDKYDQLKSLQNHEGWFPEYGGFDFGYSTLSLDLLAAADQNGAAQHAGPMAQKLASMLASLSGDGAGYPGRLGCRGTAHLFPFGAEHFSDQFPDAENLAANWRESYRNRALSGPGQVDDRYFAYFYFPQFALAFAHSSHGFPLRQTPAQSNSATFPDAGISFERYDGWSLTKSRHLGGALAVQIDGACPAYHLGYELVTTRGERFSSAHWSPNILNGQSTSAQNSRTFVKVSGGQPLVNFMVPFHIVTSLMVFGRLAEAFQKTIKSIMIRPTKALPCTLERSVSASAHQLIIRDTLRATKGIPPLHALLPALDISVHSPSARQDRVASLPLHNWEGDAAVTTLNQTGQVSLEYVFALDESGITGLKSAILSPARQTP